MWKKDNSPAESAGSFKLQPESKQTPSKPSTEKPEAEGRSTGYTALDRSSVRKDGAAGESTLISSQSTVNGEISGQSDVKVYGNFQGTIDVPKNLVTIELSGYAKATINAQNVSVHGKVFGTVTASETVHLLSTGNVDGDIRAANVVLDKGSTFNGAIEMVKEKEEKPVRQEPKPAVQTRAKPATVAKSTEPSPSQGT